MRALVERMSVQTSYLRVIEWFRLLTITGIAQVSVQLTSLISGILVIRLLSTHEYALYTIANTTLGMMTLLADGGISTGVFAEGSRVWQDRTKLGAVLVTGLELRKKFAIGSLIVSIPILAFLLEKHDASWFAMFMISCALVVAFFTALSGSILQVPFKLSQHIIPLQKNAVGINLGRLALLACSLFLFPFTYIALLANGIPQWFGNRHLLKNTNDAVNWKAKPDGVVRKNILTVVKRILPGSVYYCLSGQITIWLISFFGSTEAIAQVGALSRLSMVLTVINTVYGTLVAPRFARLQAGKQVLLQRYVQIQFAFVLIALLIIGIVSAFPDQALWVLGTGYADLQTEFVLTIIGSCLSMIAGASFTLSTSKGWIIHPAVSITAEIAAIISGVLLIDISTIAGILYFNIYIACIQVAMYVWYCLNKITGVHISEIKSLHDAKRMGK